MPPIIGIDFGTTNSVVARLAPDGRVEAARFPFGGELLDVFRTVLCFTPGPGGAPRDAAGPAAIEAYLEDPPASRLIMSMKSYLAQRSFSETRILTRSFTLEGLAVGLVRNTLLM